MAKGIMKIALIVLVVFAFLTYGMVVQASNSGQSNIGGVNTFAHYNVANEVHEVFGYNISAHKWYVLSFTADKSTGALTVTIPSGISIIDVQTSNTSQDVYHLAQNNAFFSDANLKVASPTSSGSTFNGTIKLDAAYMYMGQAVNSSAMSARADKGVTGYGINETLYSSNTNNLGSSVQIAPNNLLRTEPTGTAQYMIFLNNTAKSGHDGSFILTQNWEYTVQQPVVTWDSFVALAIMLIVAAIAYALAPVHYGKENQRVISFQEKKEMPYAIAAIVLEGVVLGIIGLLGTATPLGGWGGAFAGVSVGGAFIFFYTMSPMRKKYHSAIGILALGTVVGFIINLMPDFGFGSIAYNFFSSGNGVGVVAAAAFILVSIALIYVGLINTKRVNLRARNLSRE